MVAIELAASCRPLRKSKARATNTRTQTVADVGSSSMGGSEVLEQDAADPVGHVLEAIDHLFQVVVDLGSSDEVHGPVLALLEQGLHAGVEDLVRAVLDA